jgi:para-nitrobenzyl esterase
MPSPDPSAPPSDPGPARARPAAGALLAAVAALSLPAGARAQDAATVVRVDAGPLRGVAAGDVVSFKGVPYAAPPVGPLRWRAPQPVAPWPGVRPADRYGAVCVQRYDPGDNGVGPLPMSEDCLTLNVFAPATGPGGGERRGLPVMVWIHGGGYVNGSGTAALYDGSALARQGAVVVTLNYRLGRLGFFAHPALTRERADSVLGNYGLLDIVAALQWVRRNAAAFGGDADNVTVFGESAGGNAVERLMVAPMARGLFHKAVSQSGLGRDRSSRLRDAVPAADGAPALPSAEAQGQAFAEALGVRARDAAALRAIPLERIVAAGEAASLSAGGGPLLDGVLLTEEVDAAFARGAQARVPFLLGSNSAEFAFAREGTPLFAAVATFTPEERAAVVAAYGGAEAFSANVVSDLLFVEPARQLARLHARAGAPTYLYRFSALSASARDRFQGAPHASDRQYVFRTLGASPWPTDARDSALADTMSAYWVAFARTGDPNGGGRPRWPAATPAADTLLDFTDDGPRAVPVPHAERLDALAAVHAARATSRAAARRARRPGASR